MILRDHSIRGRMMFPGRELRLTIEPLPDDECFQPASVDLRLGNEFIVDGDKISADTYALKPGEAILGTTREKVTLPPDLVGQVWGKSSRAREFLLVHCTAGYIDPSFSGQITLEFVNLGKKPFLLTAGMKIAQINFTRLDGAAERPYGSDGLGSHYQHQIGVVPNRSEG